MRTSKPCSTISYNSAEFLELKLNDLVRKRHIDFWAYLEHEPEEDEKKKHKHLLIYPGKLLDTNQLKEELEELYMDNLVGKPLGVMPFRSSKFADWFLYVIHDTSYLASKGQKRKYHYKDSDIVCSDTDFLAELKHTIDWSKINTLGQVIQAAEQGMSFIEFVKSTNLPLQQIGYASKVFELMSCPETYRDDRFTHTPIEPKIDADGVIIDE